MKTTNSLANIPRGLDYIKIDVGTEFLYVYDINDVSAIHVSHSKTGKQRWLKG